MGNAPFIHEWITPYMKTHKNACNVCITILLLYRDSVVSLSVYFDDLIVTTVTQKKEIDELGLLSKLEYATKLPTRGSDKKISFTCNFIF